MPTITIKNGKRTVKLSKREQDTLRTARVICNDLAKDFPSAKEMAESASDYLQSLEAIVAATEAKPAAPK